jgi:hypothetical protein
MRCERADECMLTNLSILPASSRARMMPALPVPEFMMFAGEARIRARADEFVKRRVCNWNRVMMPRSETAATGRRGGVHGIAAGVQ